MSNTIETVEAFIATASIEQFGLHVHQILVLKVWKKDLHKSSPKSYL